MSAATSGTTQPPVPDIAALIRATRPSRLSIQPERSFHHLHAAAADMDRGDRAVLLADARQQEARSTHVDALPDLQFQFAILTGVEISQQRRAGRGRAAGGGV